MRTSFLSLFALAVISVFFAPKTADATPFSRVGDITTSACNRVQDSLSLVQLYNALDGPYWLNTWNLSQPMNLWIGVTLSSEGCVEYLNITDRLRGTVPDITLPNLKTLRLWAAWPKDSTYVTALPDFSGVPNLEELHIGQLVVAPANTSIPDFGHLPKLKTMEFSLNQFTGLLTNFSHLPELETLILSFNFSSGHLLDYDYLPNLKKLSITESVDGEIPDFQNIPGLKELYLSGSKTLGFVDLAQFTGQIPNFTKLPNLERLSLSYLGQVTTVPNFSHLPKLQHLEVTGKKLYGVIPDFDMLPMLHTLRIGGYRAWFVFIPEQPYPTPITGTIPDFSSLPELEELDLSLNALDGALPDFSHLPKIKSIDVGNNLLPGTIPPFANLPNTAQSIKLTANEFDSCALLVTTAQVAVTLNLLTFESILPNLSKLSNYNPQDSIPVSPRYFTNGNGNKEIDLRIDENVSGSTYKWYQNNVLIGTTSNNNLELPAAALISDVFYVLITNLQAPGLTLTTKKFRVSSVLPESSFTWSVISQGCNLTLMKFTNTSLNHFSSLWTFPSGNPSASSAADPPFITFTQSGTYNVTLIVTNNIGSDTISQQVAVSVQTSPSADFSVNTNGLTVTCTASDSNASSYFWNFSDLNYAYTGPTVVHTYLVSNTYPIILTLSNACGFATLSQDVTITPAEEPKWLSQVNIYPIPASDQFTLEIDAAADIREAQFCLRNSAGQSVLQESEKRQGDILRHRFEVGLLPAGIYFLEIRSDNQRGIWRVVIE